MSDRILVPLGTVPKESVQWLWPDRMPLGGITLLDGDPGDGKSTVMYDIAARLTVGLPMPLSESTLEPAGVVLLQAEDSVATTVRPSIEAAGGDVSQVLVYDRKLFADNPLTLPTDKAIIKKAIGEVNAKLLVIDPLAAFLGGNANSESSARKVLSELALIAEEMNIAVVIVRHLTKGRSANTKYRGSGAIGIIGAARSALLVGDDPDSNNPHQHVLAVNKSNLSDAPPVIYRTTKHNDATTVEWLGLHRHDVKQLSEVTANRFDYSQLDEACYVLYTILNEEEEAVPAREVQNRAKEALVSQRTLMRAKKKLGVTSQRTVTESEDGTDQITQWVWKLPKDQAVLEPYKERLRREAINDDTDMADEAESVADKTPGVETARPDGDNVSDPGREHSPRVWDNLDEDDLVTHAPPSGRQWDD